jgi:exopolyphosphatase/guanosine-5'-triphosphate,3'-diphosphate pyrophosphatase
MKLAAIDLGSNSFHAVVVELSAAGQLEVIDREKDRVRLGAGSLVSGRLSGEAMRRGLEVLRRYRRIAENHGVEKILAVATAAIREAENGEEFLDRAGREVGIWPRAASGEEEARLVYLAALHSVHVEGRALVLDIGGGSVEMALGKGPCVERAVSARLGSIRMTERFCGSDPLSPRGEARLAAHVGATLGAAAQAARNAGFDRIVGTSGTILSVGALALSLAGRRPNGSLHHVSVPREAVREARRRLVASRLRERRRMPQVSDRADIVVAGAVVLDEILELTGARDLLLCEWALREGVLLQYLQEHPRSLARAEAYPDVRRRSVAHLAERCRVDDAHARHVASLGLRIFDALAADHGLGPDSRFLLESAALLHDAGRHISYPQHHKHTYYLVKNGGLRGLSPVEIETIALVARYHRQARPTKRHAAFAALGKRERRRVRVLAGILRLAESLDRSHRQVVCVDRIVDRGGSLRLLCRTSGDSELERWGAARHVELLERALRRRMRLRFEDDHAAPRLVAAKAS